MNSNLKLKIGDPVQVICGKEKGKIGKITAINRKTGYICLDTFPITTKALLVSKNPSKNENKLKEKSISIFFHISNVLAWDELTKKSSRIGIRVQGSQKMRFFKKSGNILQATTSKMSNFENIQTSNVNES